MVLQEHVQEHAAGAAERFNAGETIIEHVSNSSLDHPLIQLPTVLGVNFSVTKHVFMLWLVAATVFVVVTWTVRRYLKQGGLIPRGPMNALEAVVEYVRDSIVLPNVGRKWVNPWTPLILTFFFFILFANAVGLIPIFEVLGLFDHWVLHTEADSLVKNLLHVDDGDGQLQRHRGPGEHHVGAIIVAGTRHMDS